MTKQQKEYRNKHNITDSADICEIAHKLTVKTIAKQLRDKWYKKMSKVKGSVCPVWGYFRDQAERKIDCNLNENYCKKHNNEVLHYTDTAQNIFNDYYDLICEQAGL